MDQYPELKRVQIKVDPLLRVLTEQQNNLATTTTTTTTVIPAKVKYALSLDMSLEKKLIEEYSKKVSPKLQKIPPSTTTTSTTTFSSSSSASNATEQQTAVNSLADTLHQLRTSPAASVLSGSSNVPKKSKSLDDLAMEVSNLYMPDDTPQRRQAFAKAYALVKGDPTLSSVTDIDVLRAFMLFETHNASANADYEKDIVDYLKSFSALKELGFPEEAISTALLLHKNNQEEALEHLMKHS